MGIKAKIYLIVMATIAFLLFAVIMFAALQFIWNGLKEIL